MTSTQTTTETVSTHELRTGDVVWNTGMRILLGSRRVSQSHPIRGAGECVIFQGEVLNPEEVRAAGVVPMAWLYQDAHGQLQDVPTWTVQGNGLARWAREV